MPRVKQTAIAVLYGVGGAAVIVLLVLAATGSPCIPFPDAMLPMNLRELALAWLAIGFLPMLAVSIQFCKQVRMSGRWERLAVFLPAAVCLAAMVFWLGVWTLGTLQTLGLRR